MADHNDLGNAGEELACKHLRKKGYEILKTNWRFGKDEVDIIAQKEDMIVFIEVKTRSSRFYGEPYVFVTKKKQSFLQRAADAYFDRYNCELEGRFDVISIVINGNESSLEHIERAFYPVI